MLSGHKTIDLLVILRQDHVLFLVINIWSTTLANSRQAKKRARQAEKRRLHNHSRRAEMRTYIKRVLKAVTDGNKEVAAKEYRLAVSTIDRLASKGLIHQNKAARHKSRLNKHIKDLSQAA